MKLADELRRDSRRNPISIYYDMLIRDLKTEAREGGYYKIIQLAPTNYNPICKKLINDGFDVIIHNYKIDNPSHMVYIIWDKKRFEEYLKENTDIDVTTFHHGLI